MSVYRQIYYQIVFGTLNREPAIPASAEQELYKYIWGIIKNHGCRLYRNNGMADHIHICSDLHPAISLSDYVKAIKVSSSKWMKEQGTFPLFKNWQSGYGAFTYNQKEKNQLIEYIKNQKVHHKHESFLDDYKRLLMEQGNTFDERYLM